MGGGSSRGSAASLPFWVAALALGFLAVPRAAEVRDFDEPWPAVDRLPRAAVGGEA